jgi:hypothetical protein
MNVPNISQGPGSVTALPRQLADGDTVAGLRADTAVRGRSSAQSQSQSVSFARLAWFDLNGDGSIDPRSAAAGGDATLLVPAHAIDLPTYARAAHTTVSARSADTRAIPPGNTAQANRAVVAYQRYGQTPPAVAPAPPPPPAAKAAPVPVVTPERAVA